MTGAHLVPDEPKYYVRREVQRPEPSAVRALSAYGVATVHEVVGPAGVMSRISPITPGLACCGPAITCLCMAGDNLLLHAAVEVCQPGDVLVVATSAPSEHGMFGELLATLCKARGIAGVVIDAGVRDTADLRRLGLPVWAKAVSAVGTTKQAPGRVNGPIVCGGVAVSAGDVIVADDDGVVVVCSRSVSDIAAAAAERDKQECTLRSRFAAGELSVDVLGLRPALEKAGVSVID